MSLAWVTPFSPESERLERLQAEFAAGILGAGRAVLAQIQACAPPSADERLGVYCDAYRARLTDALRDTYGHSARYLGEEAFSELAHDYIESHTPQSHSIRWYGNGLPEWLRANRRREDEVAELAALDWALRAAFDSADAAPLCPADLAALSAADWDRIGFRLHPAFQLLEIRSNTVALWHALDRDEPPPALQKLAQPAVLLVWRRELQPHFRTLEDEEARALRELHRGTRFSAVCAGLAQSRAPQDAAALAGQWLSRWVEDALLVGVR
jgi:hypothetical protein